MSFRHFKLRDRLSTSLKHGTLSKSVMFVILCLCCIICRGGQQPLSVTPLNAELGRFPSWREYVHKFDIRNDSDRNISILHVRSSCACTVIAFTPTVLTPGEATVLDVTLAPNSLHGKFHKKLFLETNAPGQKFIRMSISGTALPFAEVTPKQEVYLGRLKAGVEHKFKFNLVPAAPDMRLMLIPHKSDTGTADIKFSCDEKTNTYVMDLQFQPETFCNYGMIRRSIAVMGQPDIPPLALSIMFTPTY